MSDPTDPAEKLDSAQEDVKDLKLESSTSSDGPSPSAVMDRLRKEGTASQSISPPESNSQGSSPSSVKSRKSSPSPVKEEGSEEKLGGEIEVKVEPGQPPKLSRKASQKVVHREPPLFDHLPDSTEDATKTFQILSDCAYANKSMGLTEAAMECDCAEEWGKTTKTSTSLEGLVGSGSRLLISL